MRPTSEPAKRIATLFSRRLSTEWQPKEIKQFKKLAKAGYFSDLQDLSLIERYYAFERRKGDKGVHRRDLPTFINNWCGELDRAREWEKTHPEKRERKIIPMPLPESPQPQIETDFAALKRFKEQWEARNGRSLETYGKQI